MGPLFKSPPRPLLKLGLQRLARYGTQQETISRKPEQMFSPSDTRLEWPEEGLLSESDSNECSGGIIEVMLGALGRYGTHQETMSGRLEQVYLPSDSRLDLPGEGPLFEMDFNKWWEGGGGMWALFKSLPGSLFTSGLGPWSDMALE